MITVVNCYFKLPKPHESTCRYYNHHYVRLHFGTPLPFHEGHATGWALLRCQAAPVFPGKHLPLHQDYQLHIIYLQIYAIMTALCTVLNYKLQLPASRCGWALETPKPLSDV